jgi:hypothetical protein
MKRHINYLLLATSILPLLKRAAANFLWHLMAANRHLLQSFSTLKQLCLAPNRHFFSRLHLDHVSAAAMLLEQG